MSRGGGIRSPCGGRLWGPGGSCLGGGCFLGGGGCDISGGGGGSGIAVVVVGPCAVEYTFTEVCKVLEQAF